MAVPPSTPFTPADITKMQVDAVKYVAANAIGASARELHSTIDQLAVLFGHNADTLAPHKQTISDAVDQITQHSK